MALLLYKQAAEPDRSNPDVVVYEYVSVFLTDRNDARTADLVCSDQVGLAPMKALRDEIETREKKLGNSTSASLATAEVATAGTKATVTAEVTLSEVVNDTPIQDRQRWRFELVNDGGWRVCTAERLS